MSRWADVIERVGGRALRFDARNRWFTLARTLLALGSLSLLLTTSTDAMFVPVGPDTALSKCNLPFRAFSAFCWAPPEATRWAFVTILLVVASGFMPRLSAWLHWYVVASIALVIDLPEGGDQVLVAATLWIAVVCLADNRLTGWTAPRKLTRYPLQVIAWAALIVLRLQMAYVYLNSSMAKLAVDQWGDGTAIYYVMRMEFFGATGPLGELARWVTAIPVFAATITWGTMLLEFAIAVCLLGTRRMQQIALLGAVALHVVIILLIGLFSFGLAMIGAVLAATSLSLPSTFRRRSTWMNPPEELASLDALSATPGSEAGRELPRGGAVESRASAKLLIFDGDCAFCSSAVGWLEERTRFEAKPYQMVDLHALGLSEDMARKQVWLFDDASRFGGAAAFARLLRGSSRRKWRFAGAMLQLPIIASVGQGVYRVVAVNRQRMPGATVACKTRRA
ncbi:MAG: sporulation-delaying protein SdpB family protein [Cumulibacter sp.]